MWLFIAILIHIAGYVKLIFSANEKLSRNREAAIGCSDWLRNNFI